MLKDTLKLTGLWMAYFYFFGWLIFRRPNFQEILVPPHQNDTANVLVWI